MHTYGLLLTLNLRAIVIIYTSASPCTGIISITHSRTLQYGPFWHPRKNGGIGTCTVSGIYLWVIAWTVTHGIHTLVIEGLWVYTAVTLFELWTWEEHGLYWVTVIYG